MHDDDDDDDDGDDDDDDSDDEKYYNSEIFTARTCLAQWYKLLSVPLFSDQSSSEPLSPL